jgi:putative DNA primase/helicase
MADVIDIDSARSDRSSGPRPMDDWQSLLMTNSDHSYKGNLSNCMVVFRHAPPFAGKIGRDIRSRSLLAIAETPAGPAGPWTDDHSTTACAWIQRSHIPAKLSDVEHAVHAVGGTLPLDPLADSLRNLEWDGGERLGTWLTTYCGAAETEVNSLIGSKFLIGTVARALAPGCRMDIMLVLEGAQGVGKSTLIKILGGDYTGENLPDFHSRDAMQVVGTKWIVEVGELSALRKAQVEDIKSFLSRTADTFVGKYQRHPITVPRTSVLIGNINPAGTGYLLDSTGNRRFWPVAVGTIDLEAFRRDRDQLLAEAVYCYNRGDPWWVENEDQQELLGKEQEVREEADSWEEILGQHVADDPTQHDFTSAGLAADPLGMQPKDINRGVETRIGIAMKKLGFSKHQKTEKGRRQWVFRRPPAAAAQQP